MCKKVVNPQASPLMEVTTDIQSHEGETVQEADFATDLTDSKFTSDGMVCKFGGHAFVPISRACKRQTAVRVSCLDLVHHHQHLLVKLCVQGDSLSSLS